VLHLEETEQIKIQRVYVYMMVRLQVDKGRGSGSWMMKIMRKERAKEGPQGIIKNRKKNKNEKTEKK
jgi:hypothetical protein